MKHTLYFENLGYFAHKQPNYEWSFTDDIKQAKQYISLNNTKEKLELAMSLKKPIYGEIRVIDGDFNIVKVIEPLADIISIRDMLTSYDCFSETDIHLVLGFVKYIDFIKLYISQAKFRHAVANYCYRTTHTLYQPNIGNLVYFLQRLDYTKSFNLLTKLKGDLCFLNS